jgi:4-hydroxybenzoate polyprenyltransferase
MILSHLKNYAYLMRLHKPIGIFLLLWPTLWALWLAGEGKPDVFIVAVFVAGVIIMRSAGCIINDFADRHLDLWVERTCDRVLTSGKVSVQAALGLFAGLMVLAFGLVLTLNRLTVLLAIVGAVLTVVYPFLKRVTHLPQIGLGLAFAFGVPMAFAAELNQVPWRGWVLFLAAVIWPVIYDTYYARVDREDDVKIGIKSTAILFGKWDRFMVGLLQTFFLLLLVLNGSLFHLNFYYFVSLFCVVILFVYQQWITSVQRKENYFRAFLNNNWVGLVIFLGIAMQGLSK